MLVHGTARRTLENTVLGERGRTPKGAYRMIPFIWNVQNKDIYRQKALWGCLGLAGGWRVGGAWEGVQGGLDAQSTAHFPFVGSAAPLSGAHPTRRAESRC